MTAFATAQLRRANRTLSSARSLVDSDPDSAASRAYYAAFHAVTALFAQRNRTFKKHTAIRSALHKDLIRGGEWDVDLGAAYDFLLDVRETGDYGGVNEVSLQTARTAVDRADMIIRAVKDSCPELLEG